MPFFHAADGTQLSYESYGDGPPVLFCNSVMLSTNMWEYQIAFLVDHGYRCVLLDWRGHGRSDRPSSGYDIRRWQVTCPLWRPLGSVRHPARRPFDGRCRRRPLPQHR